MLSSVFIAETAGGYAAAINQAGTLRMQSYRITSSLVQGGDYTGLQDSNRLERLVDEYNQRLYSPRIQDILAKGPSPQVIETYQRVEHEWRQVMLPNLEVYMRQAQQDGTPDRLGVQARLRHLGKVDEFVEDIHRFVAALELDAEEKNRQLRAIQLVLLALTFALALISLYFTKRYVLLPLQDLMRCARAASHGDFSIRSAYVGEDELGQLGQAFNVMAEDLSVIYADLESRVSEKTRDLSRSNRSLELLYSATKRLSESDFDALTLEAVIHDIEQLLGAESGTICLVKPGEEEMYRFASTLENQDAITTTGGQDCPQGVEDGGSHRYRLDPPLRERPVQGFSAPIRDAQQNYGVMCIEFSLEPELESWQERLLETVASHIALAINLARQLSEKRRLALLEERSVIARELHDSIAQSLSYLKIQVSRLDKALQEDQDKASLLQLTSVLRSALNGAYRQLRELLTTFRLRVNEADLGAALASTVREFSERSGIAIAYDNQLGFCRPSPNAEIHVIQILREALSNVIRHAEATQASVRLLGDPDGWVELAIEDNGIGIDPQSDMMQHYGLPIMKERAAWLGGDLVIEEMPWGGTRIQLRFNLSDNDDTSVGDPIAERNSHV
ncbi:MAG: type IV pili methyl-accepting chemotaxis transducer N-terminal domain-containing protein [Candidatus Thiodiazotropha sp.]